jgi:trehalose/maltose hydrolase-like predicted phosphorylase
MDPWLLVASEPDNPPLYLANGYLGTSLGWDSGLLAASEPAPCYIRGVYDRGTGDIDHLANIPCWNLLKYGAPSTVREYRRELDLRRGFLQTDLLIEEARGLLRVASTMFLSRSDPHAAAIRIRVVPAFDGEISFLSSLEANSSGGLDIVHSERGERSLQLTTRTGTYGIEVAQCLRFEEVEWRTQLGSDPGAELELRANAIENQELTLTQTARIATTLETDDPTSFSLREGDNFDVLQRDHERAWAELWKTDIEIDGDPQAQQFARAGLFYLWSSLKEGDDRSIAPMGLSSNFYNGHVFWDAELWMYPSLLITQPKMAKSCVAYRRRTLDAARDRAAANGHAGAQFPWEGAFTGEEMTPEWCETRDYQLHITADVALAQWWHFIVTADLDWLRNDGFPVIRACAEYWESRVEYSAEKDHYEVSDVVCADEYAVHVNNDAFTNAAVSKALLIALRAAEILGEPQPASWREIAEKIHVPYDPATGTHLEFDGYAGEITKQADVELLAFPLERISDPEQVARDLDYYAAVIDPDGPAMSYSIYSIISAQLGRVGAAYDYLRRSYEPNARRPFFAFSETPSNNEYFFCTGAGGALQAFLFGFTGLRLREGYFSLNPLLPDHWKSLRLHHVHLAGAPTDIEIYSNRLVVRRHSSDSTLVLSLDRESGRIDIDPGSFRDLRLEFVGANGQPIWSGPASELGENERLAQSGEGRLRLHVNGEGPILETSVTFSRT